MIKKMMTDGKRVVVVKTKVQEDYKRKGEEVMKGLAASGKGCNGASKFVLPFSNIEFWKKTRKVGWDDLLFY